MMNEKHLIYRDQKWGLFKEKPQGGELYFDPETYTFRMVCLDCALIHTVYPFPSSDCCPAASEKLPINDPPPLPMLAEILKLNGYELTALLALGRQCGYVAIEIANLAKRLSVPIQLSQRLPGWLFKKAENCK